MRDAIIWLIDVLMILMPAALVVLMAVLCWPEVKSAWTRRRLDREIQKEYQEKFHG